MSKDYPGPAIARSKANHAISDEGALRRSLFDNTGGSFPELITRGDIKVFLPPIGGLTVYCFGDPAKMSDPNAKLSLRVHDECNGSDVFGSDICTCRPYLLFGIEEAVKQAQAGGSGVVIYFRKEGRALGEVTKVCIRGQDAVSRCRAKLISFPSCAVSRIQRTYVAFPPRSSTLLAGRSTNARPVGKRGVDRASEYFQRCVPLLSSNVSGPCELIYACFVEPK